jgi:SAM-dependent methyltransferase
MANAYDGQAAQIYDAFYDNKICRAENDLISTIFNPFVESAVVVDLGAGTGLLKRLTSPFTYVAIDESEPMLQTMPSTGDVFRVVADLMSSPGRTHATDTVKYLGTIDTVTALWAGHFLHDQPVYNMAFSMLTPNGYCLFHGNLPRRRFRRPPASGIKEGDYNFLFTASSLKAAMTLAGFKDVKIVGCNALPDWIARMLPEQLIRRLIGLTTIIPARYHYHAVAIGRKP